MIIPVCHRTLPRRFLFLREVNYYCKVSQHALPIFNSAPNVSCTTIYQVIKMTHSASTTDPADMFLPPTNRAMRTLDREFFKKEINLASACVLDQKHISACRKNLSKDILKRKWLLPVRPVPPGVNIDPSAKCILLKPEVRTNGRCALGSLVYTQLLTESGRRLVMESTTSRHGEGQASACRPLSAAT